MVITSIAKKFGELWDLRKTMQLYKLLHPKPVSLRPFWYICVMTFVLVGVVRPNLLAFLSNTCSIDVSLFYVEPISALLSAGIFTVFAELFCRGIGKITKKKDLSLGINNMKKIIITTIVLVFFASSVLLKSQDVENVEEKLKSSISVGISKVFPNSNYGENNFGINASFRHSFSNSNSYYSVNVNYIGYKDDTASKKDYLATLGSLFISDALTNYPEFAISYCYGVDVGVLYKDNGLYYGALSINMGFIWKVYKNLNFECMVKTKINKSDKVHTGMSAGLSYQF